MSSHGTNPLPSFSRYAVERELGRGGMGAVYLARQLDLDRPVALKVISTELAKDPKIVVRLNREARSAARVSSDNVVKVYETGAEGGVPFIAMEYVDGSSAAALIEERTKLPWPEATAIVLAAARGLKAAHAVGVLHRDVKPANILIARDGSIKLADFGLAKEQTKPRPAATFAMADPEATDKALSVVGGILGTPEYMSPEQADGQTLGPTTDLYALGVTYYELLTGVRPFGGGSFASTISHVMTGKYTALRERAAEVPPGVASVCASLMALEPEKRPQTAEAAIDLLQKLLPISGQFPQASGPLTTVAEGRPGLPAILAVSVVVLLGVVIGGGAWVLHSRPVVVPEAPPSPPPVVVEAPVAPPTPPPVAPPVAEPPVAPPPAAPPPVATPAAKEWKPFPVRAQDLAVFEVLGTPYDKSDKKRTRILGKGVSPTIVAEKKPKSSRTDNAEAFVFSGSIPNTEKDKQCDEKYQLEDDGRIRLKLFHRPGTAHESYVLDAARTTWLFEYHKD